MSDYETLVERTVARYPHLVMTMSGPWREHDGRTAAEPWICSFRNASLSLCEVHPGSAGTSMYRALEAGLAWLETHADDPRVRDHGAGPSSPSPG